MPSIEEFDAYVATLSRHDWYYDYSDDHIVWKRGNAMQAQIMGQARSHEHYSRACEIWQQFVGSSMSVETRAIKIDALREQINLVTI